jgi:glycosyltransferase involved in cell wall biosynthesis
MTADRLPRVSIGIPVYNGENFLDAAVESVLNQTFTDFELIICDNASTDGTQAMCRAYEQRDPRVRYHRNEHNLGASRNYNRVFELSAPTEYFKWVAHDDTIEPTFLEKAVAALDADPGAVLCQSLVVNIDEHGDVIDIYDSELTETLTSERPSERFKRCILSRHRNLECFGLVRRWAMEESGLMQSFFMADRTIVVDFCLRGRFIQIREPLFGNREHRARATNSVSRLAWANHHDTRGNRWIRFGHLMLFGSHLQSVRRHVPQFGERMRCYGHLVRWWGVNHNARIFFADFIAFVSPRLFRSLRQFVKRWSGEAMPVRIGTVRNEGKT